MAEQPEKSKKHRPGRSHRSRRANPWNILRRYILMGCLAGVVLECAYFHPLTCAVTPLLCAVFLVVLGLEGLSTGKHRRRHKRLPSYPPRRVLSVIVWVGLGLVVLQIIPLPRGVLSLVSPRAVEFRAESGVFPERFWSTVSLCPFRSRLALLK